MKSLGFSGGGHDTTHRTKWKNNANDEDINVRKIRVQIQVVNGSVVLLSGYCRHGVSMMTTNSKLKQKKENWKPQLTRIVADIVVNIEISNVEALQHVWVPFFAIIRIEQHIEHTIGFDVLEAWVYFDHLKIATGHRTCPHQGIRFAQFQIPAVIVVHQAFQRCKIIVVGNARQILWHHVSGSYGRCWLTIY